MSYLTLLSLADCPRILMAGVPVHRGGITGVYFFPEHWCLHLYTYTGEMLVDDAAFPIAPGACSLVPPAHRLVYRMNEPHCRHAFVHFAAGVSDIETVEIPMIQQLGGHFTSCFHTVEMMVRDRATRPRRADVRLHDMLYTLTEFSAAKKTRYSHPVMRPLLEWIELHIGERFSVHRICREFALSHNYLNRVFRRDMGSTIGAYIQHRRADLALRLLTTTRMPVKIIAAELGYTDLAQFSTFIKRAHGRGPRAIRNDPGPLESTAIVNRNRRPQS